MSKYDNIYQSMYQAEHRHNIKMCLNKKQYETFLFYKKLFFCDDMSDSKFLKFCVGVLAVHIMPLNKHDVKNLRAECLGWGGQL